MASECVILSITHTVLHIRDNIYAKGMEELTFVVAKGLADT